MLLLIFYPIKNQEKKEENTKGLSILVMKDQNDK
jgi:hypothetical protein